ncbi:MAG: response regulator [Bdellovibrionota bacterium]
MFDPSTKILVVDDMMTMRKIEMKILRELGFTDITEAGNGIEAWEALSKATVPFGLIISDWNMPNCSGLDLLKRLRADQKLKATPFVMVTAEAEKHQVFEAMKCGVDQYVVKPFNKDSLLTKLEQAWKKVAKVAA